MTGPEDSLVQAAEKGGGVPLIQGLLLFVILVIALHTLVRRRHGEITTFSMLLWLILWTLGGFAVAFPGQSTRLARFIGVGRGADLITYVSVVTLFYILFRLVVRIERLNRDITELVRAQALHDHAVDKRQDRSGRA